MSKFVIYKIIPIFLTTNFRIKLIKPILYLYHQADKQVLVA